MIHQHVFEEATRVLEELSSSDDSDNDEDDEHSEGQKQWQ